jgi:hypothetical protein
LCLWLKDREVVNTIAYKDKISLLNNQNKVVTENILVLKLLWIIVLSQVCSVDVVIPIVQVCTTQPICHRDHSRRSINIIMVRSSINRDWGSSATCTREMYLSFIKPPIPTWNKEGISWLQRIFLAWEYWQQTAINRPNSITTDLSLIINLINHQIIVFCKSVVVLSALTTLWSRNKVKT